MPNFLIGQTVLDTLSAEELKKTTLEVLQTKASSYYQNIEIENAIYYAEAALNRVVQDFGKQDTAYSYALTALANAIQLKGDYKQAENLFLEALEVNQSIATNQKWRVALSYKKLGEFYFLVQRMDEAMHHFEKARNLLLEVVSPNSFLICNLYYDIGMLKRKIGRLEEAEILFEQVLRTSLDFNYSDDDHLIGLYNSIAGLNKDYGRHEKAEVMYLKAQALIKKKYGENHPEFGRSLNNMGILYKRMKQYEKAEKMYLEGLRIRREALGPNHYRVATVLGNLGQLYFEIKLYNKAVLCHEESLAINLRALGPKTMRASGSYNALARDYWKLNKLTLANDMIYKALNANSMDSIDQQKTPLEIAKSAHFFNHFYVISIFNVWADIKEDQYHAKKDVEDLKEAFEILLAYAYYVKRAETELSATSDKMRMLSHATPLVRRAFKLANRLYLATGDKHYLGMMLRFAEDNKSALLSSTLHAEDALLFGDVPDSLIEKEHESNQVLSSLYSKLMDAQNENDTATISTTRHALIKANLEKERIKKKLEQNYPAYSQLRHQISEVDVEEIQRDLLDSKTALLEFFISDEFSYLMLIQDDDIFCYPISFEEGELKAAVEKMRKGLSDYEYIVRDSKKATETYKEAAHYFYKKLIAPAAGQLEGMEHLIIVPDGELGHIPFEVLLTRPEEQGTKTDFAKLDYLINDFNISYSYSALLSIESKHEIPAVAKGKIMAFAAEYGKGLFSMEANRTPNQQEMRSLLIPLKGVKKEVETLEDLFKERCAFYYGKDANEKQFKALAQDYSVIHLAMHGLLNQEQPLLSSLAFTENGDPTEDNFLEAYEISNLQLNNQLIVLSACETGYGKFAQGEGVLSLARSFMYAGVPSLVVSLWQVNDGSTSIIMKYFYQAIAEGKAKDIALREAKLRYIKVSKGLSGHPAFWSAFIQLGDSRPVEFEERTNWMPWALGALFLLLIGGVFIARRKKSSLS